MELFQLYLTTAENLKTISSSAVHQLQTRYIPGGFYLSGYVLTLFCGLGWRSMKQTTPRYRQLGQDRGVKKQPGFGGVFLRWRGWVKKATFHSEVTVSLFQVMDVWRQKSVWEMRFANPPLWAWEQLPPAEGRAMNSIPTSKLLLTHCSQQGYSCEPSVTQGQCFHCLLKATLWPLTRPSSSALSHWWTATTDPGALPVASEHPCAQGTQPWAGVILLPGTPSQLFHKAATWIKHSLKNLS